MCISNMEEHAARDNNHRVAETTTAWDAVGDTSRNSVEPGQVGVGKARKHGHIKEKEEEGMNKVSDQHCKLGGTVREEEYSKTIADSMKWPQRTDDDADMTFWDEFIHSITFEQSEAVMDGMENYLREKSIVLDIRPVDLQRIASPFEEKDCHCAFCCLNMRGSGSHGAFHPDFDVLGELRKDLFM
ncbi:hypothetical protein IV203_000106 [Nitzschia inconspicua]|uniref:Uncharacterized protein n=1 Tax=Nitzschia inconspicua TaxID=303405 RepID=A0A9K3PPM9_9STRA|nr:hypothetical protein IV203_000106 [Nitzschia inconspicua]